MSKYNWFFVLVVITKAICVPNLLATYAKPEVEKIVDQRLKALSDMIITTCKECNMGVALTNQSIAYACAANGTSIDAFKRAGDALNLANEAVSKLDKISNSQANIGKQALK
jgi:hypothetical protein